MRIWLDPTEAPARGMTVGEVVEVLRAAERADCRRFDRSAAGPFGWRAFSSTLRRSDGWGLRNNSMTSSSRPDSYGRVTCLRDIGRIELGAQDYTCQRLLDSRNA